MLDGISAGENITCTITAEPRSEAPHKTLMRLMRRDPVIKKSLRQAQERRRKRMHSYIRGGRMWYSRERVGKIARVEKGNSWTMPFTFDIAADLQSVSDYVKVSK